MNDLSNERMFKIKEFAGILKIEYRTVNRAVKVLYPKLMINGITTYLNQKQCTEIKKEINRNKALDPKKPANLLYLIYNLDSKYTKIGITNNFTKRFNTLLLANAGRLGIHHTFKLDNARATETFLHSLYNNKHVLGEWFNLNKNDIIDIEIYTKKQ